MRVIVSGSRDWSDERSVHRALDRQYRKHVKQNPTEPFIVVHGNAKGADTHAKNWAERNGVTHEPHKADWGRHRRGAGPIRNKAMVDAGADLVLAFPRDGGTGTQNLISHATKAGIPTLIHPARDSKFRRT